MNPTLHPRLLNGIAGDPAVFVEAMHAPGAVLFDCGDLSALSTGHLLRVDLLCVSHAHMDHWSDFDRLLRPLIGRAKRLQVVGPPGFAALLERRLRSYTWNLVDRIAPELAIEATEVHPDRLHRVCFRLQSGFAPEDARDAPRDGPRDGAVLEIGALRLHAALLDHHTPSLGFALEEAMHLNIRRGGPEARGLPLGPWLAGLKAAVALGLPDDHAIPVFARTGEAAGAPRLPLGALRDLVGVTPGQRIAYLTDFGDTPPNRAAAIALARDADTLFIEAPFLSADAAIAADRMHLTTRAAGSIAREAGVRRLAPFHLSPRYAGQEAAWTAEIEAAFGRPLSP
ncbi:MBL fold metallo-hydrolase [Falsiroseomonas oryziterrae]|uniref:MBL fold metallo-hydrolase n=1 Tax=Falsiroseomonas oryziterrae TaxID=2911368 RepID=UPI001F2AE090|nr:MBL fold metallo-hydrolase [Roseomonas sp. NPKOSM-4]